MAWVGAACRRIEDEVPSAKSLKVLVNTAFLSFCMGANYRPFSFEPIGRGSNPSGRTIYLIYKDIFDDFDRRFRREIVRVFL